MGEGGRDIWMFDCSEIPESPEVEHRIRERGIGESEVLRDMMGEKGKMY